ncbi:glycerol-3-phosphate dehydrogenase/oxidase [Alkalihalobacillus sp. AL-G]|uniref:glycerol-3-phosphate dehydrogenase/oxidase n=1 Tax=Alkalihalobacillus sp. AL-G TaxID=2926399 RepID=UPI00272C413D|nr:glycerol-3-phosphate dehydrogenase/oxidase [Alkalihalobacillus sp. AL-G]WLD94024.1 glycerol-3-phosphate dehydrogenase/oxidase [Alkalihalobacillus sp. AL-G]
MRGVFSVQNRTRWLEEMQDSKLDVLVIGGGITGAGVLLDAQKRGLSCGLVEMQDFAAGTSSRSTKLIHGGLRYLKQFEWKLVAEVGRERKIVYRNAPHVTQPIEMLLPIIKGGTYGILMTNVGLMLYDFLAKVEKHERRTMLNKEETLKRVPMLKADGLKGSGRYIEYRTDDARLTMEVLKTAIRTGAYAVNYCRAENLLYDKGKVTGVQVVDSLSGASYTIKADVVVNATGPWVDDIRALDRSKNDKHLHITKGVHLIVSNEKLSLHTAVYFDAPDGRMIFAIPRDGKVYIGTTDTFYEDDRVHPTITPKDRHYLLEAVNAMFPEADLSEKDIESSWSGLRPLIHEEGKDPSEISRKDEIFLSKSGLVTIAGGKLTGYRMMAKRTVDSIVKRMNRNDIERSAKTGTTILSGGEVGGPEQFSAFVKRATEQGVQAGFEHDIAETLSKRYGSNVEKLYEIARWHLGIQGEDKLPIWLQATLIYSIEEEMTATLTDFFIRRTSQLYFHIDEVEKWKEPVRSFIGDYLNWTVEEAEKNRLKLENEIIRATGR